MTRGEPFRLLATTQQFLADRIAQAEQGAHISGAEANRFPRASNEAEEALERAGRHSQDAARLQWVLENTGLPEAEWSAFRAPDADGWSR